eukprot:TRINITY_DN2752_c0_g1_i1.p1 TRINITY_DN2752_c0_g1~~TRINITY_DN2752_c0_g1_i1.p1  ORF type:complete len:423 (+),score=98.07 TRINITY_DN2752_c0_g1_i1:98-1366(+)
MIQILYDIARDLYLVLLFVFVLEQLRFADLLHDATRKGVIVATVCIAFVKIWQLVLGGSGPRGPLRTRQKAPDLRKTTEGGGNDSLTWAHSGMQGWRQAMEDTTLAVGALPQPLGEQAFFGVFDGHGGVQVSRLAAEHFPKVLCACAAEIRGSSEISCQALLSREALPVAMLRLDEQIREAGKDLPSSVPSNSAMGITANRLQGVEKKNAYNYVGSTAVVALVLCGGNSVSPASAKSDGALRPQPRSVVVANCGDSRAIVCRAGKAIELTEDHKPEAPEENARIKRAGGYVARAGPCHRIDGWGLNLSRALGDFHYKARCDLPAERQKVVAVPEIRTLELTPDDEFLVLGCDGVFELNTSQEVVDIVRRGLASGLAVDKVAELLLEKSCSPNLAMTGGRGGDNCSAIVVALQPHAKISAALQ